MVTAHNPWVHSQIAGRARQLPAHAKKLTVTVRCPSGIAFGDTHEEGGAAAIEAAPRKNTGRGRRYSRLPGGCQMGKHDRLTLDCRPDPLPSLVAGFEELLRADQEPSLDDIVAQVPVDDRSQLTKELLRVQIQLSHELGRTCDPSSLCERYPEHTRYIRELFRRDLSRHAPSLCDTVPQRSVRTSTHYCYRRSQFAGGGQGTLYKGTDEELGGREMVIKFLRNEFLDDQRICEQFEREAEVTAKLDHPGIVPVYTKGTDADTGRPFYTMRLIHGSPLDELIRSYHTGHRQPPDLVVLIEHLVAACNTVAYAHNVGLLHCDLKPKNIMSGRFGATIVVDWGLAREFAIPAEPADTSKRLQIRRQGTSDGFTIPYASPEQLQGGRPLDPTSDVYSLGATLYEILTGQPPFDVREPDVQERVLNNQFPAPRQIVTHVPKQLQAICLKAMRREPHQRYATATDLAHDLQRWLRDEEVTAAPDRLLERIFRLARRHRLAATFVMVATTILLVAATAIRVYQLETRDLSASFDAALNVIERFTVPLANDETGELEQFKPLADDVRRFADGYLEDYGHRATHERLARVNELRGAIEYFEYTTARDNHNREDSSAPKSRELALQFYQTAMSYYDAGRPSDLLHLARNELTQGRWLSQIAAASRLEDKPELQVAVQELRQAIEHLDAYGQRCTTASGDQQRIQQRLQAETHHLLGEAFLQDQNRYAESRAHFLKSIEIRERLKEEYNDDSALRDLARGYGYLGDVEVRLYQLEQAQTSYQQSLEYRRRLYQESDNHEHAFQYGRGLTNFGRLALGYGTTCPDLNQKLREALDIQSRLAQMGDQRFIRDYVSTLLLTAELKLLGAIDVEDGSPEPVLPAAEQLLEQAQQSLPRLDQASTTSSDGLCQVLLALMEKLRQNSTHSQTHARQAIKLLTDGDKYGYDNLDRNSVVVYALGKAILGEPDAAQGALRRAVQLGNNEYSRFERHLCCGGLTSLANDPVIEQWMESMRAARTEPE